eukprot:TRINITY_DN13712_c0_g1_i1.p1 TRINITY_DN13712_c0_g1~~TRINITY_DN13712_c0_g1_i1.p1  ORF type:complete len:104 (-),score=18.76 TRINITY_DN13712_c0_g1_i1:189-500(-)
MQNWLRHQIDQIQQVVSADEAEVTLERDPNGKPPYRVRMRLNEAEPGITVETEDHSLQGAAAKAVRELGVRAWAEKRSWIPRRLPTKRNVRAMTYSLEESGVE